MSLNISVSSKKESGRIFVPIGIQFQALDTAREEKMQATRNFSDYLIFVDESGDHGLTTINPENSVFVLAFCIALRFAIDSFE